MTSSSSLNLPQIKGLTLSGQIGRGNTSRVFQCTLSGDDTQEYAVKVPLPETLAEHAAAERFANEVRLSLQFQHPNLVRGVSGVGFGPQAHLVMPLYAEGTLADQQQKGRNFSPQELLEILGDIATGMEYLHQQGGVHQDIKPQNVYLNAHSDGPATGSRAALGDFGSTYLAGGKRSVSGSPFYMSPEIYHGEASSASSDVYSFGVMCYELLAGKRPHQGGSYEELMVSHLTQFAAPLASQNPNLPRSLTRLIDQSMAKNAAERPTASALAHELLVSARALDPEAVARAEAERQAAAQQEADEAKAMRAQQARQAASPKPAPTPVAPAAKQGFWSRLWAMFRR